MKIKKLIVGPLQVCCYVINTEDSQEALIIDPGGDADLIIGYLRRNNLIPITLINTHGHGDHIGANMQLKKTYPDIQICIHSDDAPMLMNEYLNLSLLGGKRYKSPPADRTLQHNDRILFGRTGFDVIHLPGHTKGGICLLYNSKRNGAPAILFSGDSLFAGGIGRTDLPNGSYETLVEGIRNKLFTLQEDTIVYPGHGEATSIAKERDTNPFLSDCYQNGNLAGNNK